MNLVRPLPDSIARSWPILVHQPLTHTLLICPSLCPLWSKSQKAYLLLVSILVCISRTQKFKKFLWNAYLVFEIQQFSNIMKYIVRLLYFPDYIMIFPFRDLFQSNPKCGPGPYFGIGQHISLSFFSLLIFKGSLTYPLLPPPPTAPLYYL